MTPIRIAYLQIGVPIVFESTQNNSFGAARCLMIILIQAEKVFKVTEIEIRAVRRTVYLQFRLGTI